MTKCRYCEEENLDWFQENGRWVLKKKLDNGQYSKENHNCKTKDFKKNNVESVEQSQLSLDRNSMMEDVKNVSSSRLKVF